MISRKLTSRSTASLAALTLILGMTGSGARAQGAPVTEMPEHRGGGRPVDRPDVRVDLRIPIAASPTPASTVRIDSPGNYVLSGDRFCSGDGIRVEADDVTIDLDGFSLVGPDSGSSVGIFMDGRRNVEIRNGTIRDFGGRGIHDKNGTGTAYGKRIIGIRAISNGSCGLCLGGDGNLIVDCLVADNKGSGLCVGRSIVRNNVFLNNETGGIAPGDGSVVEGNVVVRSNAAGVMARSGCIIKGNSVTDNANSGIYGEGGCLIEGNVSCGNNRSNTPGYYAGIRVVTDCIVRGNSVRGNLQNNIFSVRSGNVLEDNLATAPSDTMGNGFFFRIKDNYFSNNRASGNGHDFAGEIPEGAGDGGGNVSLKHWDPPATTPAKTGSPSVPAAPAPSPAPAEPPGSGVPTPRSDPGSLKS